MKSRGFSLLELLAGVAIVAVLAATLLPMVNRSIGAARQARCQANLRQVGAGLNSFAADNGMAMPYGYWVPPSGESQTWDKLISEYLGIRRDTVWLSTSSVMSCPADKLPGLSIANRFRRTYSMVRGSDGFGITANDQLASQPGVRLAAVSAPSRTIIVTEFSSALAKGDSSDSVVGSPACSVIDSPARQLAAGNGKPDGLHAGRMSYLFVDGHVEILQPSETVGTGSLDNPKGMWTINPND